MSMSTTNAAVDSTEGAQPAVLRGTRRGLEVLLDTRAPLEALVAAVEARMGQSPTFFAGGDVVFVLEGGALPAGALGVLEQLASRFGLRVSEVRARGPEREREEPARPAIIRRSATDSVVQPLSASAKPGASDRLDGPKMHVGPVRSGVVLQVPGDLVVVGDVNPGAEVRAAGSIVVMGSLRGLAHAAFGREAAGYIIALRIEAQQLRIGGLIARAGEPGGPARGAEIAYAVGGGIVVEGYQGKLPAGATGTRR